MVCPILSIHPRVHRKSNHLGRQDDRQSPHMERILLPHLLLLTLQHRSLRFLHSRLPRLDQHDISLSHRSHADLQPHRRLDPFRMSRQRRQRPHPALLARQGTSPFPPLKSRGIPRNPFHPSSSLFLHKVRRYRSHCKICCCKRTDVASGEIVGIPRSVCLLNGTDIKRHLTHPLKVGMTHGSHVQTQGFVFGTMAMKSFYVAMNVSSGRVGLAQIAGKVCLESE